MAARYSAGGTGSGVRKSQPESRPIHITDINSNYILEKKAWPMIPGSHVSKFHLFPLS